MAKKSLKNHVNQKKANKLVLTRRAKGGFIDRAGNIYSEQHGTDLIIGKKATLSTWHSKKLKNNVESFEGGQYRGGRKEKTKNLVKLDNGNILNQHNVEFTIAERKALESAVNRANRKRKQMLEKEGDLPRFVGGQDTGQKVSQLQLMGKESDFILARKSKSMQQFKTREAYESYMENLERVNSPDYLKERVKAYKRNHIKALKNVFGDDAKDVMMKIRMMKHEDYMELLQKDEELEVSYIYDPSALAGKLNRIRRSLGMRLKEEPLEES